MILKRNYNGRSDKEMIPDNVEKIIMTKEDYDKNVEQLLVEKLELEQELQRKDNIINELKKYLEYEIEEWKDVENEWGKIRTSEDENILDKIKELEESNENRKCS